MNLELYFFCRKFCGIKNIKGLHPTALGAAEPRCQIRLFGGDCLSGASFAAI
jgi:hypothetical protein